MSKEEPERRKKKQERKMRRGKCLEQELAETAKERTITISQNGRMPL
jgi:hypothetical protein